MSENERHATVLRRWLEMWNTGDVGIADEILADGFRDHTTRPHLTIGREPFKGHVRREREGLPDLKDTPLLELFRGEWAMALYRTDGTHRGEYLGVPPTQRRISFVGLDAFRFEDGLISEWWWSDMSLEVYHQLDVSVSLGLPGE